MQNILGQITLLVDDYDKALSYYTELLDFELLEDTTMSPEKRWVVIAPLNGTNKPTISTQIYFCSVEQITKVTIQS